jgi:hypothetical protein
MTWNAFKGKLVYQGVEYKSKGSEFERIIDLPRRVETPLHVAFGGANAPLERLEIRVIDCDSDLDLTPVQRVARMLAKGYLYGERASTPGYREDRPPWGSF